MENTKLTPKEAFETIYSRLNFLERACLYGEEAEIVRDALYSMAKLSGGYFPPEPDSELGVKMSKETDDQSIVARSQAINARSIARVDRIRRSFAEARLAPRILAMCKRRGWSLHWSARGAYLHLEASELIEAIRGKRGDPKSEAADVLLVLMSITEANGISWSDVVAQATATCARLETCDPYPGEERQEHECATSQTPHTRSTLFRMPAQITFYTLFTAFQTLLLCWEIAVALDLLPN